MDVFHACSVKAEDEFVFFLFFPIEKANLKIPVESEWNPVLGGRKGYHTEHLDQLVAEMSEVFRIEPNTEW